MTAQTVVPITFGQGGPRTVSAFIVTGDRPFLVDTGTPGNAPAILGRLEELGIPAEEIAVSHQGDRTFNQLKAQKQTYCDPDNADH